MVNFTSCQARWVPLNASLIQRYGYDGPVRLIPHDPTSQITLEGCRVLCGTGVDLYRWSQSSSTMTTWVFPIIGILLQAPFVSNAFRQTVFDIARWIGSPMASMSYILWNIWVTGRCAMIVDMAVPFDHRYTEEDDSEDDDYEDNENEGDDRSDHFGSIRDSFYLLNVMNQYTMSTSVLHKKEAEGLLRFALFSKELRLLKLPMKPEEPVSGDLQRQTSTEEHTDSSSAHDSSYSQLEPKNYLDRERQRLAKELRAWRRRAVVPVFISTGWFLFSLAISIQSAFGLAGQNAQAHDLALGLSLSWLPVLILCSIVDRNPVAADEMRKKLNRLVDHVRRSLMDNTARDEYFRRLSHPDSNQIPILKERVKKIQAACPSLDNFFGTFAGQGRVRWHYGCCHPIVSDIEGAYIAKEGRGWLCDEKEARNRIVLADVDGGLDWFDYREVVQILLSVLIVGGTILGAFVLSYFTPTVGLGCRSGGYLIFGVVALGLLMLEMLAWWIKDADKPRLRWFMLWISRMSNIRGVQFFNKIAAVIKDAFRPLDPTVTLIARYMTLDNFNHYVLTTAEVLNACWLVFILLAQTFGVWQRCECLTSSWGGANYMDLTQWAFTSSQWTEYYWIGGTATSISFMSLATMYVVTEWCVQSHLSTFDSEKAANGLQLTRYFRLSATPLRWLSWKFCRWGRAGTLRWSRNPIRRSLQPDRSSTLRTEAGEALVLQPAEQHTSIEVQTLSVSSDPLDSSTDKRSTSPSPKPSSSQDPHAEI